eukprot:g3295.t1
MLIGVVAKACLQRELRDRFAEPKFQDRLQEIERKADGPGELARKRQELMLEVQSVVLPKYGFEGSRAGVYKMMAAMGPYVEQPEFTELAEEINCLLGLRSPPENGWHVSWWIANLHGEITMGALPAHQDMAWTLQSVCTSE